MQLGEVKASTEKVERSLAALRKFVETEYPNR